MDPPAFLQFGQAAPWLGLLIVVSTNAALLDGPALEWSSSLVSGAAGSPPSTVVIITGRDAVTGERTRVVCATATNGVASETLLVDLNDSSRVVSRLCGNSS